MNQDRLTEILNQGGSVDPGATRALIRVTGSDRLRFLDGQLSNAVGRSAEAPVYALALDAKGRLEADLWVHDRGNAYLLDTPRAMAETLMARLDRYLIADDVQLELVDEVDQVDQSGTRLVHVIGRGGIDPRGRFGLAGTDHFPEPGGRGDGGSGLSDLDLEEIAVLEILTGTPVWGHELTPGLLPPEARLEDRAIDYSKGCYTGQEVISRMKRAGKVNRILCGWIREDSGPLPAGAEIRDQSGAAVGEITRSCLHPRLDRTVGLGYVRFRSFESGDALCLDDGSDISHCQFPIHLH